MAKLNLSDEIKKHVETDIENAEKELDTVLRRFSFFVRAVGADNGRVDLLLIGAGQLFPVSYTHLDVYKRQVSFPPSGLRVIMRS